MRTRLHTRANRTLDGLATRAERLARWLRRRRRPVRNLKHPFCSDGCSIPDYHGTERYAVGPCKHQMYITPSGALVARQVGHLNLKANT